MDPVANLTEQRKLAASIIAKIDADRGSIEDDAERLAELVTALDEWRTKGGFDPYTSPTPDSLPDDYKAEQALKSSFAHYVNVLDAYPPEISGGDARDFAARRAEVFAAMRVLRFEVR